jgi:WhiB family redox-sensing transcriptional regulator
VPKQEEWRQDAACRGADLDLFFPISEEDTGPAKAICASCPVREACLEWAIATHQEDGVFGGLNAAERRRLRRRRRTAARITAASGQEVPAA